VFSIKDEEVQVRFNSEMGVEDTSGLHGKNVFGFTQPGIEGMLGVCPLPSHVLSMLDRRDDLIDSREPAGAI